MRAYLPLSRGDIGETMSEVDHACTLTTEPRGYWRDDDAKLIMRAHLRLSQGDIGKKRLVAEQR